jgi:hypothetical protein
MKKLSTLAVIGVVWMLIVVGCGPNALTPPTPSKDPESVLRAITEALNKKDVEAATARLADDVTQTLIPAPSGTGIYQGKDAMRARFEEVVAGNPTHRLTSCQTSGDKVTCAATYSDDSTKPLGFDLEFNVEAVVQNGLLRTVTWQMTDQSLAKLQAAMAPPPTPAPNLLGGIVEVMAKSLNAGDVEGALAYFTDNATVKLNGVPPDMPDGYRGKTRIRQWFKDLLAAHFEIKVEVQKVEGDTVTSKTSTWQDTTRQLGVAPLVATEVYEIKNGKIASLTWTISPESLAKLQAALPAPTPAPTKSTAPLELEVLASKPEDVVGVWLVNLIAGAGKGHLEFKADGTYNAVGVSGAAAGAPIDSGKYTIEGNQLKLDTTCITVKGDVIPCVPIYQVYVTRQGGRSVMLRFVAIDDQGADRKQTLNNQKLKLVEQ